MAEVTIKCATAFGPKIYMLPAVKESLYHPRLPTFRRMEMDNVAHKLPDQHCRTTTPCNKDDFRQGISTLGYPLRRSSNATEQEEQEVTAVEKKTFWEKIMEKQAKENRTPYSAYRSGYTKSYHLSTFSRSMPTPYGWKYTFQQEPYIDHIGPRPCPANIFSRYRVPCSSVGGRLSNGNAPWKP